MSKKISFGLSIKEVQGAIKELQSYRDDLNKKCEELCRRLTEEGIQIASGIIGNNELGRFIRLGSEITPEQAGCKAILYMSDSSRIRSEWKTLDGVKSSEISPTLMLEFGSGQKAENPLNIPGVGTGTFPGGTHGNESEWYYMDLDGVWHRSSGIAPKMPMYRTAEKMREILQMIANEIFRSI